jgi:Putative zinc-finger
MTTGTCSHADAWLMLPWLANGRLPAAERMPLEEHVRGCPQCARELAVQRRLCEVLTEPERVSYAPGPSFRKLMDRIDGRAELRTPAEITELRTSRLRRIAAARHGAWRPPGLAWAASFALLAAFLGLAATTYRWSQPLYTTHTEKSAASATAVLHVAFVPSLSIAGVGEALHGAGARLVEGPDATGIVGVAPVAASRDGAGASADLHALAARLRADARVRWVEPVADAERAAGSRHGPPQP